jgi:hypothetical protein
LWHQLNNAGRVWLASFFAHAAGFTDITANDISGDTGDPMFVIQARKE